MSTTVDNRRTGLEPRWLRRDDGPVDLQFEGNEDNADVHWRGPVEWTAKMGQFAILFEDCFPASAC